MWLLDVTTYSLHWFVEPPRNSFPTDEDGLREAYATLSHTWGNDEVSFNDIQNLQVARKKRDSFRKIDLTCKEAKRHGLRYAWVDTCCIDKRSSAELTEAINSMFKWYQLSAICFVYLCDFVHSDNSSVEDGFATESDTVDLVCSDKANLADCKWFSRGWTLQELIAPHVVCFFDRLWCYMGDRLDLLEILIGITGIERSILNRRETRSSKELSQTLQQMSIAKRMSWAAKRRTTRSEDEAYCLLGLFDVNLPLLYGEGFKAFVRLQEAIMQVTTDQSILLGDEGMSGSVWNLRPHAFRNMSRVMALRSSPLRTYESHKTGILVRLPIVERNAQRKYAMLNCRYEDDFRGNIGIEVRIRPEAKRSVGTLPYEPMMAWLVRSTRPPTFSEADKSEAQVQLLHILSDGKIDGNAAMPKPVYASGLISLWFELGPYPEEPLASVEAHPLQNWNRDTNVMQWREGEHGEVSTGRVTWRSREQDSWTSVVYQVGLKQGSASPERSYMLRLEHGDETSKDRIASNWHEVEAVKPRSKRTTPKDVWNELLTLDLPRQGTTLRAHVELRDIMDLTVCVVRLGLQIASVQSKSSLQNSGDEERNDAVSRDDTLEGSSNETADGVSGAELDRLGLEETLSTRNEADVTRWLR